ncbi:hypothetical protein PR048_022463 [Dryococelus australis]|uniref:Uncharacterized protein n=1 Tax=Dryococelus australis TaxID=614101 RepID=A0ABQ9H142_9NEOP|nr:hypothetical protein PR048_022463 [Dryococelus australis]
MEVGIQDGHHGPFKARTPHSPSSRNLQSSSTPYIARAHSPGGLARRPPSKTAGRWVAANLPQLAVMRRGGLRRQPVSPEYSCVVAKRIGNSSRREEVCDASKSRRCRHSRDSKKGRIRRPRAHHSRKRGGRGGSPITAGCSVIGTSCSTGLAYPVGKNSRSRRLVTSGAKMQTLDAGQATGGAITSLTSPRSLFYFFFIVSPSIFFRLSPPRRALCEHSSQGAARPFSLITPELIYSTNNRFAYSLSLLCFTNVNSLRLRGPPVSLLASHQGDPGSIPGRVAPGFPMWESCRTMTLAGGFSRRSSVSTTLSLQCFSILASITLVGYQDLDFESRPNLFTHSFRLHGNRPGRCRWSAGFLGDLPFPPPLHSGAAPYSLQSPASALKTSLLRAAQISSLYDCVKVSVNLQKCLALNESAQSQNGYAGHSKRDFRLIRYFVRRKRAYWLGRQTARVLPGADWATAFQHFDGQWRHFAGVCTPEEFADSFWDKLEFKTTCVYTTLAIGSHGVWHLLENGVQFVRLPLWQQTTNVQMISAYLYMRLWSLACSQRDRSTSSLVYGSCSRLTTAQLRQLAGSEPRVQCTAPGVAALDYRFGGFARLPRFASRVLRGSIHYAQSRTADCCVGGNAGVPYANQFPVAYSPACSSANRGPLAVCSSANQAQGPFPESLASNQRAGACEICLFATAIALKQSDTPTEAKSSCEAAQTLRMFTPHETLRMFTPHETRQLSKQDDEW